MGTTRAPTNGESNILRIQFNSQSRCIKTSCCQNVALTTGGSTIFEIPSSLKRAAWASGKVSGGPRALKKKGIFMFDFLHEGLSAAGAASREIHKACKRSKVRFTRRTIQNPWISDNK